MKNLDQADYLQHQIEVFDTAVKNFTDKLDQAEKCLKEAKKELKQLAKSQGIKIK